MEYAFLLLSLVGIVFGADYLVSGSASIARRYKISDFIIGAVIVGVGTSMPELTVSFIGALKGNADVAIGNVVGSNIFNILGILGLTALLFPITIDRKNLEFEIPFCVLITVLLGLLVYNLFTGGEPIISRLDGCVLLAAFGVFLWFSFKRSQDAQTATNQPTETSTAVEDHKTQHLWKSVIKILVGLPVLVLSCDFFIENAIEVAHAWGVNDAFISLTLIACGTSLPELAASLAAAWKKNAQLALGNVVGSNIFNTTWILGLSSLVMPLPSSGITGVDYIVLTIATCLLIILGIKGKISRLSGGLLLSGFIAYTIYLLSSTPA